MYISLSSSHCGNACAVRQSILNYTQHPGETQFFDWLVTSMKSVNQLLEHTPIQVDHIYPNSSGTSIYFKHFDLLISHHDIGEFNENSIQEVTEKYTRRYERFLKTIQEQTNIHFIRYCKNQQNLEEEEILLFIKHIQTLNPNLNFTFILMSDGDVSIPTLKDHVMLIRLNPCSNEYSSIVKQYQCIYVKNDL
jgi:hypothetical protein